MNEWMSASTNEKWYEMSHTNERRNITSQSELRKLLRIKSLIGQKWKFPWIFFLLASERLSLKMKTLNANTSASCSRRFLSSFISSSVLAMCLVISLVECFPLSIAGTQFFFILRLSERAVITFCSQYSFHWTATGRKYESIKMA